MPDEESIVLNMEKKSADTCNERYHTDAEMEKICDHWSGSMALRREVLQIRAGQEKTFQSLMETLAASPGSSCCSNFSIFTDAVSLVGTSTSFGK